jgi:hypothetical protein
MLKISRFANDAFVRCESSVEKSGSRVPSSWFGGWNWKCDACALSEVIDGDAPVDGRNAPINCDNVQLSADAAGLSSSVFAFVVPKRELSGLLTALAPS